MKDFFALVRMFVRGLIESLGHPTVLALSVRWFLDRGYAPVDKALPPKTAIPNPAKQAGLPLLLRKIPGVFLTRAGVP